MGSAARLASAPTWVIAGLAAAFAAGAAAVSGPRLSSMAFSHGEPIHKRHTCDGADVSVPLSWDVAPPGTKSFAIIAEDPDVRWHQRPYRRGEVASYRLAITATDDPAVNRQVARDGEAANVLVNSADDPANCSFILPAVVRRGDLQLTVSTNGRSPAFASWARRRLEETFTDTHARLLELLSEVRDEVKAVNGTTELPEWEDAIDDELIDLIAAGDVEEARARVRTALGLEGSR